MRRTLIALAAAAAFTACGRPDPNPAPDPAVPPSATAEALPEGAVRPRFVAQYLDGSTPEWLQIMRQADGAFIQYSPATLLRYPAQNTAEVWIQIIHREPQREAFESEQFIEHVDFTRERYRYWLDCANNQFTILERQIMSGEVAARAMPMDDVESPRWRPILTGGPAAVLKGPLCEAV